MISTLLFSLSALCFAAILTPRKTSVPARETHTYYMGNDEPQALPTWKRKGAPIARFAQRVG